MSPQAGGSGVGLALKRGMVAAQSIKALKTTHGPHWSGPPASQVFRNLWVILSTRDITIGSLHHPW